jgi:hypothetical protein
MKALLDALEEVDRRPELVEGVRELLSDPMYLMRGLYLQPYVQRGPNKSGSRRSIATWGELGIAQSGPGWAERPVPGGWSFLREVVYSVDIIKAILLTYVRKVSVLLKPASPTEAQGYVIERRDGERLTPADERRIERLRLWLDNCGDTVDPYERRRLGRHTLAGFVSRLVWDTLAYDACPIEIERNKHGDIVGIYAVDPITVRLAVEPLDAQDGAEDDEKPFAYQVIDGVPRVEFRSRDMVYEVRNPRTDLWACGYGFAESEMIVRVLTSYISSFEYNAAGLDRNAIPRGLLTLFGEFKTEDLVAFRSELRAMLRGAGNRWQLPVLTSRSKEGGAQYQPIDTQYNEMYFARWMTMLVSIACAVYSIDPAEIHFDSFNSRSAGVLASSDTSERLAHSKSKGFIPLLNFVARILNEWIIRELDDRYVLRWSGLDLEEEKRRLEFLKLGSTVQEIRALSGQPPIGDEALDNAPVNPSLMQVYMFELQSKAQQSQYPGAPGDFPLWGGDADEDGTEQSAGGPQAKEAAAPEDERGVNPDARQEGEQPVMRSWVDLASDLYTID